MLRTIQRLFLKQEQQFRSASRFRCVLVGSDATNTSDERRLINSRHSDQYKLQFNGDLATESKSFSDILRAVVILKLCTIDVLVNNSEKLVAWCKGIFGIEFYERIIKATIYKQFVAGETEQDVKFIASNLQKSNINCMFCVPTEDASAGNLFMNAHDIEDLYDTNLNLMLECVDLTASLGCYAQSKITPVISPDIMHNIADLLSNHITSHEDRPPQLSVATWSNALDGKHEASLLPECSKASNKHLKKALKRLDTLANRAEEQGVKLMLDAEHTYLQASIDLIILALQKKYNRNIPVVYNTYQCYRKDTPARIQSDIELAEKHNFKIACKLVRGAYMQFERERAAEYGYPDPICETIDDTERNYKHAMDLLFSQVARGQAEVTIATHNEDCIKYGVKKMQEIGVKLDDGSVSFAQLYGMCDHVSYELGNAGYIVHKSVPYGTVDSSILYLLRRAQENKSVMARTAKESGILLGEMKRRMWRTVGFA